jgi:signal transduction histidine kinase
MRGVGGGPRGAVRADDAPGAVPRACDRRGRGYGPAAFLRDRAPSLVALLASVACAAVVMRGSGVSGQAVGLVVCVMLLCFALDLACSYLPRRRFWRQVERAVGDPREALGASDVVDVPGYPEGVAAWEALDAVSRAGQAHVAAARRDADDYRSFVEAWVHEVKTPIAAARLICENEPGPSSGRLQRELDRMDGYVEQALYYARSGSVSRDLLVRRVRVGDFVGAALRAHKRSLIDARVSVLLGKGMGLTVFADAKWMAFVVGQLAENAAKYRAPEGSGRTPELRFDARAVDAGRADERVELDVSDNGMGISAADLPRVFDKGFVGENGRVAGQARSTGIGLYLVRELCEKMGLSVRASSRQGEGSRFTISFPTDRERLGDL